MKTHRTLIFLFIPVLAAWIPAANGIAKNKCNNAGNVGDLLECSEQMFQSADKEMNRVYKLLYAAVEKNAGKDVAVKLDAAQQSWLAFRDKECNFAASTQESLYPIMLDSCLTTVTDERTKKLKSHLKRYQ